MSINNLGSIPISIMASQITNFLRDNNILEYG